MTILSVSVGWFNDCIVKLLYYVSENMLNFDCDNWGIVHHDSLYNLRSDKNVIR